MTKYDASLSTLIAIVGPTAVGKTDVGILVAKALGGEIVSADSMLIYRYMDIGTAKPTVEEMQDIPHYMIDIIDPDQNYSVALYQEQAEKYIKEINSKGKYPILVGGTGLYVRSVIDHYNFSGTEINWEYRRKLNEIARIKGNLFLHNCLKEIDPETAEKLHPNDRKRVIRAMEVFKQTGRPISSYHDRDKIERPKYNLKIFGLIMERNTLYQRIEQRVDKMIERGLLEEVKWLLDHGYKTQLNSMKGLGYKEIAAYWSGELKLEESIELLKRNTRRFAKRQLTWFRRDPRIQWYNLNNYQGIHEVAQEIIKSLQE
ncbi:tRNA (adenosine(37)-N6)-dimethylallyltransferase MiaA [Desulfolucanica intricata]|uniref:tRNA (adenosine(37)-N6)-dimethylallyltransferase MiaA n=1 Tax=Desulfolucanica intricata TaxID=1285191 RepID=UPI000829542A|nr:tRNA (adenosine(37)-N6)-dimethylallyltransferase MiaA [Desulfolucanica intricata]